TGRASLTLLHDLPIDTLKLDASFVRRIADSARDRAIVAATIALARRLRLRTIAEGVESPAVLERLRVLRCDAAQGHWLGAPAPAAALLALAKSAVPPHRGRE
ncbi:MAG: EAL domain-containing protein, partial [Roseiflexaceae bacterium]|nr:EAL domain-containing protein [Roseiflexaceae bacterium]